MINMVKCITCEKKIDKNLAIKKYKLYFCSVKCLIDYEEYLKNINKDFKLDDCC